MAYAASTGEKVRSRAGVRCPFIAAQRRLLTGSPRQPSNEEGDWNRDLRLERSLNRLVQKAWIKLGRHSSGDGLCHDVKNELLLSNETDTWQPGFIVNFEFRQEIFS